jgi:predicted RND superfamily exporter protein
MNEFLKMDIFFVVATVALVVFVLMLCVALWYMIKILRSISHVADTIDEETESIKEDLDEARASVKRKGASLLTSLLAVIGFAAKTSKRLHKKRRSS